MPIKQLRNECDNCRGSGMMFPDCNECEGNGWVRDLSDGGTMTCPECYGEECDQCTEYEDETNENGEPE